MKTSELTGAALDWAVAKCEGEIWEGDWYARHTCRFKFGAFGVRLAVCLADGTVYNPSTDWSQGGPIIEREGILLRALRKKGHKWDGQWLAMYNNENTDPMVLWVKREDFKCHYLQGLTPLIAAMRCYVASKLGDSVELPEGLTS